MVCGFEVFGCVVGTDTSSVTLFWGIKGIFDKDPLVDPLFFFLVPSNEKVHRKGIKVT